MIYVSFDDVSINSLRDLLRLIRYDKGTINNDAPAFDSIKVNIYLPFAVRCSLSIALAAPTFPTPLKITLLFPHIKRTRETRQR